VRVPPIAYTGAVPLVVDKGLSPWQALESSKAITHKWFTVFGLFFGVGILVTLSMIPVLLGLIWTIPWAILCFGVLYHRVFGVSSVA
jgi:hypothetical protein